MSQKDYYHWKIEEAKKAEELERRRRADTKYDPSTMDCERMPLGCWLFLVGLFLLLSPAIVGLIGKMFRLF